MKTRKKVNVIVKKEFTDRYTGLRKKAGDKMTITEDRYREIKRSGDYVEVEKTSKVVSEPKTEEKK